MSAVVNLATLDLRRRRLVEAALAPDVLIGMPHLTPQGLSETWLLKELAHRHWLMLGRSLGLEDADFRTPGGGEVYAAICACALRDARFESVAANDIVTIRSSMAPVGRTRMGSVHRLSVDGRMIGEVELISAFVHRTEAGRNGSIARVRSAMFETDGPGEPSELARRMERVRRGELSGAGLGVAEDFSQSYRFKPSQMQDFNGAGLFYFVSFQGVADRAVESWFGAGLVPVERQIFFTGNIEAGEDVIVKLRAGNGGWSSAIGDRAGDGAGHWISGRDLSKRGDMRRSVAQVSGRLAGSRIKNRQSGEAAVLVSR